MKSKIKFIRASFLATLAYALSIYFIDRFNIFNLGDSEAIYDTNTFIGQLLFFWLFMYFFLQFLSKRQKRKEQ